MLNRRKVLLYKVETAKGTDPTPDPANDLILPDSDIQIKVAADQDMGENELKGTMGPGDSVTTKQSLSLDVSARVRGLGQGATALLMPHIHPALMASGHSVTSSGDGTTTAREAVYAPTSDPSAIKSGGGYFYEDGLLYKLLGSQNNLSFEATMSALKAKFTIQAGYAVPTVVALPTWATPAEEVFRMTSALCSLTDGGATINIGSFTFDPGVDVQENYETDAHYFEVADRKPTLKIDPRAVATADDWNALTNCTGAHVIATFTNSIGETLVFDFPKAVPSEVSPGNRAGRITREKTFSLKETAGDDQYSITWTSVL